MTSLIVDLICTYFPHCLVLLGILIRLDTPAHPRGRASTEQGRCGLGQHFVKRLGGWVSSEQTLDPGEVGPLGQEVPHQCALIKHL